MLAPVHALHWQVAAVLPAYIDRHLADGTALVAAGPTASNTSTGTTVASALQAAFVELDKDLVHTVVEAALASGRQDLVEKYEKQRLGGRRWGKKGLGKLDLSAGHTHPHIGPR